MLISTWALALIPVCILFCAIWGFGLALSRQIFGRPIFTAPILGLSVFSTLSFIIGVAGFYSGSIQLALAGLGVTLMVKYHRDFVSWWRDFINWSEETGSAPRNVQKLWLVLPLFYFIARFFSAGLPQQHSDALYYHLLAPKFWAQWGQIKLTQEHPSFVQATLWESILGLPLMWLKPLGFSAAKIAAHIAGQWMHVIWGQIATLLMSLGLFRHLIQKQTGKSVSFEFALFLCWLFTCLPSLEWTGGLVKNDYILFLLLVVGTYESLRDRFALAGFYLGIALSTKLFAFWTGIALLVFVPWRHWPRYIAFGTLGACPVWIRNVIFAANPVFPVFDDKWGPFWISNGWRQANELFAGAPELHFEKLRWFWEKALEKSLAKILFLGSCLAMITCWRTNRWLKLRVCAFFAIQSAIALSILRWGADGRYGIPSIALFMIFCFGYFFKEIKFPKHLLWVFLPLGLLVRTPVELLIKVPRDYWFKPAQTYIDRFHDTAALHDWIHKSITPTDVILFTYTKTHYYLDRDFDCVPEMKSWEEFFKSQRDIESLIKSLKQKNIRYLHFQVEPNSRPVFQYFSEDFFKLREKAVYRHGISMIFDLNLL